MSRDEAVLGTIRRLRAAPLAGRHAKNQLRTARPAAATAARAGRSDRGLLTGYSQLLHVGRGRLCVHRPRHELQDGRSVTVGRRLSGLQPANTSLTKGGGDTRRQRERGTQANGLVKR